MIRFKKYFFRTEEPAVSGPSWVHRSPSWAPELDSPVLREHSLLPLWLSIWQWMCGATDDASFCAEEWAGECTTGCGCCCCRVTELCAGAG